MVNSHVILVSLKVFSSQGVATIKDAISQLAEIFELQTASAIYKVDRFAESMTSLRDIRTTERLEGYAMVLRAETRQRPKEVLDNLDRVEKRLQREVLRRSVSLNLLVYDQEVLMLPEMSLPHPEMHLRPEEIIPALEVWPDYVHPVLNVSLAALSKKFSGEAWGEFFTQGQPLLDF